MPGKAVATVQHDTLLRERAKQTLSDLVIAEVFFVQATIESASALGEGISALRQRFSAGDSANADTSGETGAAEDLGRLIERTRKNVVEPYTVRFNSLRKVMRDRAA